MLRKLLISLMSVFALLVGCAGNDIFPPIESNMSNPITLAVDSTRARLYVNNSNYRVLYETGSLHVVDISAPASPTRVAYTEVPSFGGEMYIDTINQRLYSPNRYSTSDRDVEDNLFGFDINEASAGFLTRTDYVAGDDPYGIAYYGAGDQILVATEAGQIDYYTGAGLTHSVFSLSTTLSTTVALSGSSSTYIAVVGQRAVVARTDGGIMIVNLDQIGVPGKCPIDYFISDINSPRDITTDGTYVYVTDVETTDSTTTPSLMVLDISVLAPRADNTTTEIVSTGTAGLLVANINLVNTNPQEIVLAGTNAYVTDFTSNVVSVVDLVGYTRTGEIAVGNEPFAMAVYSPGGIPTHLFVANSGDDTVSVVDLATNQIVATYP